MFLMHNILRKEELVYKTFQMTLAYAYFKKEEISLQNDLDREINFLRNEKLFYRMF